MFREQKRGGKGRAGMATKDEDAVTNLFVTSTHNPVLFFSNLGQVYRMKVWRLPEGGANTKGRPMVNLLPLAEGETISTVLPLPEDEAEWGGLHIMFATAHGTVRRNSMDAFTNVPTAGKIAMRFGAAAGDESESDDSEEQADPTDRLIGVALLTEDDDVLLATRNGKAIRFTATDVREFQSRTSTGVRGVRLLAARRGHLDVDPASGRHQPGRARGLSALRSVEGREGRRMPAFGRTHRRAGGEGAVHPDRHREWLRQALLGLRISPHQPRRPGHHQYRHVRSATAASSPASRPTRASS